MIDFDRQPAAADRLPRRTLAAVAVSAVVIVLALAVVAVVREPPAPPAADRHTIELRIDGDGVGQLARVWDATGERDVDTFGTTLPVEAPRAVLYTVQAGGDQQAQCVILLDGTEVAREMAEPFTTATCAWVR